MEIVKMTKKEIKHLASKYLQGTSTQEEEKILHAWYENQEKNAEEIIITTNGEGYKEVKNRLLKDIQLKIQQDEEIKALSTGWNKQWAYAASLLLFLSFSGIYYYYFQKHFSSVVHYTKVLTNDVSPGGNNATLEFGNNKKINLDEVLVGNLLDMNGLIATKTADGILSLEFSKSPKTSTNEYNTVRTPKGGQYRVKLPDDTEVWLNASSSIKFPSSFTEDSREVEVHGEAYFEVAKTVNKKGQRIPFLVKSDQQIIEVLGTHFNVNNYSNESTIKTTLLEGSIRIVLAGSQFGKMLKPGQESTVYNNQISIENADLESVMAWKDGDFIFNNESLVSIMKKIERWYDVEVIYEGRPASQKFSGAVSRSKNLATVLKIMELTNEVRFKIEGRRVYVMT